MAAPVLQAEIEISAPANKVWALITDFGRMGEWSPQCRMMKAFGPVRQGTRTLNLNRRNRLFWPTTSTITEVIPERKLAFRVNANNTIWSYELEPTATGTRVIETRHAENGVKAGSNLVVSTLFGGVSSFERELVDGMNTSLARIKAAAEAVQDSSRSSSPSS
ncbi:MAG TPA: SRPBCC family protein [Mycobacterium sp.]|nr:SRPBCC family protein [Mycobacterium sp.]